MLDKPFETGAILVFDAKGTVEISGNEVRNNDYGIMVQGHRFRAESVSIYDNKVEDNHRAAFIWVGQADRVEIHDNFVKDNGLNAFYDNEGLVPGHCSGERILATVGHRASSQKIAATSKSSRTLSSTR